MATYPADLRYTREHEWARVDGSRARVGITHFAQDQLGDVVFGVVESVKAVSDLFSPLSGEVVEANQGLVAHPEQVNRDPYGQGWLIVIALADPKEVGSLMSAADYEKYLETAGGH
jgi:glycine cleavage system H protein